MQNEPIKVQIEEFKEDVLPPSAINDVPQNELTPEGKVDGLPKSSCSTAAVIIFLVILLAAVVGTMYYYRVKGVSVSTDRSKDITVTSEIIEQAGVLRMRVVEGDIQKGIDASGDKFPLKKAQATITEGGIVITGRTGNSFLSLPVEVVITPVVENGSIRFEVSSIKSKNVEAPKFVKDKINENLTTFLNGYVPQTSGVYLERAILYKGFMELTGRKK